MNSPETEDESNPSNRPLILALIGAVAAAALFCGLWLTSRSTNPGDIDRMLTEEAPEARATAAEVIELLINLDAGNVDEAEAVAQVAQTTTVDGDERSVGYTLRLTLVKDDENWRADAFELLGEL